jgi:carboxyl-terminal processing protease
MRWRPLATAVAVLALAATLVSAGGGVAAGGTAGPERPPACAEPDPENPPPAPSAATLTTIGQVYYCIFDNYFSGPVLDSRTLLVPAFAALTQEMQRRGLDQADATLPALTGRKDADWKAFSKVYQRIAAALPDDATRGAIAAAAIQGMVDELDDNHARWSNTSNPNLFGFILNVFGAGDVEPTATEPAYVDKITAGSPAEKAGLRLGDEILAINGVPLFTAGVVNKGALSQLLTATEGAAFEISARRPATGETFTATVTAARHSAPPRGVQSRLVDGNIAYVSLPGFVPELADQVLAAIDTLRAQTELRGVILDLRGNGGGSPQAVSTLLGALAHGKITSYWCDVKDRCQPNRTDDSVALLNLPFVALTDRRCASACDSFSSSVKDLRLGKLVGTRTAGAVSGPGAPFVLDNGSMLTLPKLHEIGANKEVVNTVGVAPDYYAPLTAADLSAGRDPGLDKAVSLL